MLVAPSGASEHFIPLQGSWIHTLLLVKQKVKRNKGKESVCVCVCVCVKEK